MRAIFGVEEGLQLERLRGRLQRLLRQTTSTGRLLFRVLLGPDSERLNASFRRRARPGRRGAAPHRSPSTAARPDLDQREDILSLLLRARDAKAGPDRRRAARRADDAAARRPRDDRDDARLGLRAHHAPPRGPRSRHGGIAPGDEAPYTDAAIQETLRVRPVLRSSRGSCTRPITVGRAGSRLPAGTRVAPASILVHYREDVYPEPLEFRPERFLDEPPGTYTWLPFGGGMRRCLGRVVRPVRGADRDPRRALDSVELEALGGAERVGRRGFTLVPRDGARVRVAAPPAERAAGERARARRRLTGRASDVAHTHASNGRPASRP